jgi:hypothetical protein
MNYGNVAILFYAWVKVDVNFKNARVSDSPFPSFMLDRLALPFFGPPNPQQRQKIG